MGVQERDPRDIGYVALYIAIKWYQEIDSEIALRIALGQSSRKNGTLVTPEMLTQITKIISSSNFYNIETIVRKFRVNKYEVFKKISGNKNADEGVLFEMKVERPFKSLKEIAEDCKSYNCDTCTLNKIMVGDQTMCDFLSYNVDDSGKLKDADITEVQKTAENCSKILSGEIKSKGFEVYSSILSKFQEYTENHPEKKKRDIVSTALFEYMRRHK